MLALLETRLSRVQGETREAAASLAAYALLEATRAFHISFFARTSRQRVSCVTLELGVYGRVT
jgi:hypothetical protein